MATKSTSLNEDGPAKKPYESPRLEVYGDIRAVTAATGTTTPKNDGSHSNEKTG
jgi:hypothetical protein